MVSHKISHVSSVLSDVLGMLSSMFLVGMYKLMIIWADYVRDLSFGPTIHAIESRAYNFKSFQAKGILSLSRIHLPKPV